MQRRTAGTAWPPNGQAGPSSVARVPSGSTAQGRRYVRAVDGVRRQVDAAARTCAHRSGSDHGAPGRPTAPSGTSPRASGACSPSLGPTSRSWPCTVSWAMRPPCSGASKNRTPGASRSITGPCSQADGYRRLHAAVVQRVTRASVTVEGEVVGAIGAGLVALVGVTHGDTSAGARKLAERIWRLADLRRRRRRDEPGGGRHDRGGARRQPVHALRRHEPGPAAELDRGGPARAGRAPRRGGGRRASQARGRASPRAGSGPRWPWSWSTTGRSPCCSRWLPPPEAERSSARSGAVPAGEGQRRASIAGGQQQHGPVAEVHVRRRARPQAHLANAHGLLADAGAVEHLATGRDEGAEARRRRPAPPSGPSPGPAAGRTPPAGSAGSCRCSWSRSSG